MKDQQSYISFFVDCLTIPGSNWGHQPRRDSSNLNGNLKIHLREPIKSWVVFRFNSKMELAEILGLIEHFEHHTKFGGADNESNCEDE